MEEAIRRGFLATDEDMLNGETAFLILASLTPTKSTFVTSLPNECQVSGHDFALIRTYEEKYHENTKNKLPQSKLQYVVS